jgi:hypothetical protein
MGRIENFKQYAADCMQQADAQKSPQDREILLNVALAWVRLAQQSETMPGAPSNTPAPKAPASPTGANLGKPALGA